MVEVKLMVSEDEFLSCYERNDQLRAMVKITNYRRDFSEFQFDDWADDIVEDYESSVRENEKITKKMSQLTTRNGGPDFDGHHSENHKSKNVEKWKDSKKPDSNYSPKPTNHHSESNHRDHTERSRNGHDSGSGANSNRGHNRNGHKNQNRNQSPQLRTNNPRGGHRHPFHRMRD